MELFIISGMLVISFGVAIERTKFKAMLDARDARIESLFCELNAAENKALELINEWQSKSFCLACVVYSGFWVRWQRRLRIR